MSRALLVVLALLLAACGSAPRRDLDYDRLHASLDALAADPELARLALAERALAEAAVRRLDASSINANEHVQLSYLAERRVDIAYIAAQTERERARLEALQREHASLLLDASRRETAAMRAELDRQRQRELLRQEDAQRGALISPPASVTAGPAVAVPPPSTAPAPSPPPAATIAPLTSAPVASASDADAERTSVPAPGAVAPTPAVTGATVAPAESGASTLAQRLAALVPEYGADGRQMTLEDLVFEPGTATFAAEAPIGIARVAAWLAAEPTLGVRIAGHTDATGSPEANRNLSLRRAEAVRDALVERGVAPSRIAVTGEGAAVPVASNDDAAGRARNRRVVVRLGGGA
ncbi:OmpA family protein [Tahibacter sp.]|uniref:OmpA family protein n=1 Tax=Tahibacter sp. TaxID=2056211 RepID=UPI0028C49227|nr:OmpA family protein [Tahibacter sp.]